MRLALLLCLFVLIAPAAMAQGAPRTPLLMEGKTTLFQKVLTRPGAAPAAKPGGAKGAELPPLSILFVYGRQDGLVEVGPNPDGKILGWLAETDTIPWRHQLVAAFANPAGRERVVFMKDRPPLVDLVNSPDLAAQDKTIRDQIAADKLPADSPVISIEPETYIDLAKQFYLLPILDARAELLKSGFRARSVRVASVTKDKGAEAVKGPSQRGNAGDLAGFNTAIVFVVDATASMQPYIDRTREAVRQIYDDLAKQGLTDKVRFGLVAFRDDPAKVPGIEFLSKVFADPNKVSDRATFDAAVKDLAATKISTRAFAEDGYAGIVGAIQSIDFSKFGGRYLIYITDASAREGNSPLASTKLGTDQVRQLAQENRMAIFALHLQTNEGRNDHAQAKAQYERLTQYPGVGSLYFPVPAGDLGAFGKEVHHLAQVLADQVKATASGKAAPATGGDKMEQAAAEVGRAMQLAYLGTLRGTAAPRLFEAWALDRDWLKPETPSLSIRVLMTKNQLSDLQATLRKVVEAGEKGQIDPQDFFNQLRSAALAMSRDPTKIGQGKVKNLIDTGLLGEYLDGLPYQSKLMALDQDGWTRMGVGQQQALIDEIKSKVVLYQKFHDDTDRWIKLDPGAGAGDAVYPVPVDALP